MSGPGTFRRAIAAVILLGLVLGGMAPLQAGPLAGGATGPVICTAEGFVRIDPETGQPQAPARQDHCDLCVLCCSPASASAAQLGVTVLRPQPDTIDGMLRWAATALPFSSRAAPWSIAVTRAPPLPLLS